MEKFKKFSWVQRLSSRIFVSLAQLSIVLITAAISFILGYVLMGLILGLVFNLIPSIGIIYLALSYLIFGGIFVGIIFFFFTQWLKKITYIKKIESWQGLI